MAGLCWGATSALSHPTTLGKPHLRRRSCLQHDLVLQAGPSTRDLCKQQRQVSWSWLVGCDDGAPSLDAHKDAQQAGLCPSPARAAAWAGPFDALWGGQRASRRCAMQPQLSRAKSLSSVKTKVNLAHRTSPNRMVQVPIASPSASLSSPRPVRNRPVHAKRADLRTVLSTVDYF